MQSGVNLFTLRDSLLVSLFLVRSKMNLQRTEPESELLTQILLFQETVFQSQSIKHFVRKECNSFREPSHIAPLQLILHQQQSLPNSWL